MWKVIAQLFAEAIEYIGAPSRAELEEIVLRLISSKVREELGILTLEQACAYLGRAANTPPAPVHVTDLDIATNLGIHHVEEGWFAGENQGRPVWSKEPIDANRYRTIGAAEHALGLHGLRGAPGITIESLPIEE